MKMQLWDRTNKVEGKEVDIEIDQIEKVTDFTLAPHRLGAKIHMKDGFTYLVCSSAGQVENAMETVMPMDIDNLPIADMNSDEGDPVGV